MAVKHYDVSGIGKVSVYKRRGMRTMRLSVTSHGQVRVTIPNWTPYTGALGFIEQHREWLLKHTAEPNAVLSDGQLIGKSHYLRLVEGHVKHPVVRLKDAEIIVNYPASMTFADPLVQATASRGAIKALRQQAEELLPGRLRELADQKGFSYKSVQIKQLKSRWGSCTNKQDIVLNLFLMQLPWELIDYVLLHELIHTKHMNHGEDFWFEFLQQEPRAKALRKAIRSHQTQLMG